MSSKESHIIPALSTYDIALDYHVPCIEAREKAMLYGNIHNLIVVYDFDTDNFLFATKEDS